MNVERLVHMANQIGVFFQAQPDRLEAIAGVTDHLKRFWDPRMRTAIVGHWRSGGAGLNDIVTEAIKKLAAEQTEKKT